MASTTMIETVTITRPLKCYFNCEYGQVQKALYWISLYAFALSVAISFVMQTHGNLAASSLWQPGELARRMSGERPSPVPPTRELWPTQEQRLSISTLQLAYQRDYCNEEYSPRRTLTLPSQTYFSTIEPIECDEKPRFRTISTNTDPPPTVLNRIRSFLRRDDDFTTFPLPMQAIKTETHIEQNIENPAKRAVKGLKNALSGAKYRIAPNSDKMESPKIVYDTSKPGDRMFATFGANKSRKWFKLPSKSDCSRRLRVLRSICGQRSQDLKHRPPLRPPLQITQV